MKVTANVNLVREAILEKLGDGQPKTSHDLAIEIFGEANNMTRAKISNALTSHRWFEVQQIQRARKNRGDKFFYSYKPNER